MVGARVVLLEDDLELANLVAVVSGRGVRGCHGRKRTRLMTLLEEGAA